MRFVETPVFTKELRSAITDDEYQALQTALLLRPEQGTLMPKTGGLRKVRWTGKGHGKSGGYRIIYFWHKATETIYMLYLYSKNRQENLTVQQAKLLRRLVQEVFK
jgi:hypothetical protein